MCEFFLNPKKKKKKDINQFKKKRIISFPKKNKKKCTL
jgi:hypothetical protein